MLRALLVVLALSAGFGAEAQERRTIGTSRLFNNDALGDQRDRWRTGSYNYSVIRGRDWTGVLPGTAGEILEFRARAEIVSAENLPRPSRRDRRYAGILSFGVHTHAALGAAEARIGADLVVTGPVTGLSGFQRAVHDAVGLPIPEVSNQLGNKVYPMISAEIGRPYRLGESVILRPFIEGQVGFETLIRAGADLTVGSFGTGALLIRDPVTGQRVAGVRGTGGTGISLILGGDVARVGESALLPEGGAAVLRRDRSRVRAGLHWQGRQAEVFYGVAWLSPEFEAQREGQVVGSLQLRLQF